MGSIQVSGTDPIAKIPGSIRTETLTTGQGGDIIVSASKLALTEGGAITTVSYSNGNAGDIFVKVPESIQIIGSSPRSSITASNIGSLTFNTASAGDIFVQTSNFVARDGGLILSSTTSSGAGGNIEIDATKSIELIGFQSNTFAPSSISASTSGTGNAGSVNLNTSNLLIENGGRVDSSTVTAGKAGSIIINASDSVKVKGTVPNSRNPSLIISSGNLLDKRLRAAYNIPDVEALSGASGDVKVNTRKLFIGDGGLISVNNDGLGDAGTLEIFADSIVLDNKGGITAATTSGQGGTLKLKSEQLQLTNNSNITSTANGGSRNGGNITISTDTLVSLDNSDIAANAFEGRGGNVQITTQGLFLSPDSDITASSQFGIDGEVNIQTFGLDIRNSITPLQNRLLTTEQAIANSCLARRNVERGSFVITGSGGLPINPYSGVERWDNLTGIQPSADNESQASSLSPANNDDSESLPRKWQPGDPIVEAQALILKANGRASLVASSPQAEVSSADSLVCKDVPKNS